MIWGLVPTINAIFTSKVHNDSSIIKFVKKFDSFTQFTALKIQIDLT